jgi:hypothetical protein
MLAGLAASAVSVFRVLLAFWALSLVLLGIPKPTGFGLGGAAQSGPSTKREGVISRGNS